MNIQAAGADSAYGTSLSYQATQDMGIQLYTPEDTSSLPYKVKLKREDFRYDEEKDLFVCPMGKELPLKSLEREEYNVCRVYRAGPKDCRNCPLRETCVSTSHRSRTIRVNIFKDAVKDQRKLDGSPFHQLALELRQIWCEGSFAAQKAGHNLRRLLRRGLEAAEDRCLLSAIALNLKRMVKCRG